MEGNNKRHCYFDFAGWLKALLQSQSPNWCFCAAWAQVAILNCRVVFSGAKKKLCFRSSVVAAMRYVYTVNWVNCIISCLIFPHHSVLLPTALGAQPTPLRSATLQHSNLQKNGCSQMPRKLAVGHIWLYMAWCSSPGMVVLWSKKSCCSLPIFLVKNQLFMAITDIWSRWKGQSRSNCTIFWSDLPQLDLASHKSINESGKKTRTTFIIPFFVGDKKTHPSKLKKKLLEVFLRFDLLKFMILGIQPHQSNPKNSHTSWDPNDPSTSRTGANVRDALAWSPWLKLLTQNFMRGIFNSCAPSKLNISREKWWKIFKKNLWNGSFLVGRCVIFFGGGKATNTQHDYFFCSPELAL